MTLHNLSDCTPNKEEEVKRFLSSVLDAGWRIGLHEGRNQPIDIDALRRDMDHEFKRAEEAIKRILELMEC
jgi:hypothetical protein